MGLAQFFVYSIVRLVFVKLRGLYWRLTGLSSTFEEINAGNNYKKSAQVGKIIWRGKFMDFNVAQEADFLYTHEKFDDPRCVHDDNITLYGITDNKEALFVETPPDINVYSSDVNPFFYIAQYKHAVRLIKMPFDSFTKLADEIGDPKMKVILISSTGRCGSTILSQVFEATPGLITIAEPDSMTKLTVMRLDMDKSVWSQMAKNVIRLQCKPRSDDVTSYCIKTRSVCTRDVDYIAEAFPDIYQLYLYRDNLKTIMSMFNAFATTTFFRMFYACQTNIILRNCAPKKMRTMLVDMFAPDKHLKWAKEKSFVQNMSMHSVMTLGWAGMMLEYMDLNKNGVKIAAIRYEDMLNNPSKAVKAIFKYCNISEDFVAKGVEAMAKDSQRGTDIQKDKVTKKEMTDDMKIEPNKILARVGLPKLDEPCIVPGLITGDTQS
ncbi:unnamed protein product [Owenia fusiformis]|uniref:Uncharacterized protein n=1 Tax=Owenia fusiformis TaxID=6347 RepID=A0A8J1U0H7_OWEFU|nr:unnamed protein product [Owenia fusiformis]